MPADAATVTTDALSLPDVLRQLERLVSLCADVACAESRLEEFAKELETSEEPVDLGSMSATMWASVDTAITGAVNDALNKHGCSDFYGLEKAQSAQDAVDVLRFAMRREGLDETEEADNAN